MEQENIVYVSAYTPPSDSRITYIHLRKNFAGSVREFKESVALPRAYSLPMRAKTVLQVAANLLGDAPGTIYYTIAGGREAHPRLAYGQKFIEVKPEDNPTFKTLKEHIIQLERPNYA